MADVRDRFPFSFLYKRKSFIAEDRKNIAIITYNKSLNIILVFIKKAPLKFSETKINLGLILNKRETFFNIIKFTHNNISSKIDCCPIKYCLQKYINATASYVKI